MTKMAELLQKLAQAKEEVRSLNNEGKVEDAEAKLAEVRALNKQIEIQKEIDKEEEEEADKKIKNDEKRTLNTNDVEIREAFFKALQGKPLTVEERALVFSGDANNSGLIVPKDMQNQINELKRRYSSAKQLLNVVNVSTESGTFVVENSANMTGLVNFDDDNNGLAETNPVFRNVEYDIDNYGAITPVSRSFLQDESSNFMQYLMRHFARKAVMTENAEIFAELAIGKTAVPVATLNDIKSVVNVDLDPALKAISVVAMNQDAFNFFDQLEDGFGRGLLQPNPSQATDYLLLGLPVYVFSNAELATTGDEVGGFTAPVFVGALSEGGIFFDRNVYEVGISEDAGFTKNQVIARVVERFDVKQADADSYVMATVTV